MATLRRNAYFPPHSYAVLTAHLILEGEMTIRYLGDDQNSEKKTFREQERFDVEAGKVHEVWTGGQGCTYLVGEGEH